MTAWLPAVLTVARTLTAEGTIFVVGAPAPEGPAFRAAEAIGLEERLRAEARPGDTLVLAGPAADPAARDRVLRRLPAWGLGAVWLGEAGRPAPGLAIAIDAADAAASLARLVEGAAMFVGDAEALAPAIEDCTDEVCVTCSDEGRLAEVVTPPEAAFLPATVRTADGLEEVDVTLVGDVAPGDLVLVHAGGAIARIDELEMPVLPLLEVRS